jgi:leucine-rich repeat protein SHOC2
VITMESAEAEKIIQAAGAKGDTDLFLSDRNLTHLPESIGSLTNLTHLFLRDNQLTHLPESIGNLTNLTHLYIHKNKLTHLPESFRNLTNLIELTLGSNELESCSNRQEDSAGIFGEFFKLRRLELSHNRLQFFPSSIYELANLNRLEFRNNQVDFLSSQIDRLANLRFLDLSHNDIDYIPKSIGNLNIINIIDLSDNRIKSLPQSIKKLNYLTRLYLHNNPLQDLSVLSKLPRLGEITFFNCKLPRRYWTKFSDFKAEWLLEEYNVEIRRVIIEYLGYEKIRDRLGVVEIDSWREYVLLKIEEAGEIYYLARGGEALMLLKMVCPSTNHIHILRVPPELTSAEAAITWVNHGIHPDKFSIET